MKEIIKYLKSTNNENPLKISFMKKTKYFIDFVKNIKELSLKLSKKEIKDILVNKLQLSKKTYKRDSYYEAATELSVIFKMANISHNKFLYEKPTQNTTEKNPECTIHSSGFIIHAEAKCPRLPKKAKPDNEEQKILLMKSAGRSPEFFKKFEQLKYDLEKNNENLKMVIAKNKDNTMKDFLQIAHKKFPEYKNDKELNVLFVALDDVQNIQEWCNFLVCHEGFFKENSFVNHNTFSRVDVVIFSNLLYRHKNSNINESAWSLDDSFNLFLLNPFRKGMKESAHRYLLQFIKNYTEDISKYIVPGNTDPYILETLKVSWFVKEELEKNQNKYYFTKKNEN